MNSNSQTVPESLCRYLDGDAPNALHRCATINCSGFALGGDYCPRCQEELDALQAMATRRAARRAARKVRRWPWTVLLDFAPSDSQTRRISAWLERAGRVANNALVIAVILTMIYVMAEIGTAFLPGGPVERILRGGQ
jgi:hypothetical protein